MQNVHSVWYFPGNVCLHGNACVLYGYVCTCIGNEGKKWEVGEGTSRVERCWWGVTRSQGRRRERDLKSVQCRFDMRVLPFWVSGYRPFLRFTVTTATCLTSLSSTRRHHFIGCLRLRLSALQQHLSAAGSDVSEALVAEDSTRGSLDVFSLLRLHNTREGVWRLLSCVLGDAGAWGCWSSAGLVVVI